MGSNTKSTFLTKFLRPEKKTKPSATNEKSKRYSAPIQGWEDISQAHLESEKYIKPKEKKVKQNVKYYSQQNLSDVKQKNASKQKASNKRRSSPFSSWFCVSGKSDTVERSPLPAQTKKETSSNTNVNKRKNNEYSVPAPLLRHNGGTSIKVNKNRHSAPIYDWPTVSTSTKDESSDVYKSVQNVASNKLSKDSFPGVRYRFDGTLEKPYVFPAGLTFGPEGRKLQLRRTSNTEDVKTTQTNCRTNEQNLSQSNENNVSRSHEKNIPRSNEKIVAADIHRSSKENLIMEYSYEESDPDATNFDVRKAFYLKFDSNLTYVNNSETDVRYSSLPKRETLKGQQQENRWKPKENSESVNLRHSRRQLRSERTRNRYSMPPKNESFVYMGSLEDLQADNLDGSETRMAQSNMDISMNKRNDKYNTETKPSRHRYSMPIRNTDFVFMGSFENINQELKSDNVSDPSVLNESDGSKNIGKSQKNSFGVDEFIDENRIRPALDIFQRIKTLSTNNSQCKSNESKSALIDRCVSFERKSDSLTNLVLTNGASVQNILPSISNNNSLEDICNANECHERDIDAKKNKSKDRSARKCNNSKNELSIYGSGVEIKIETSNNSFEDRRKFEKNENSTSNVETNRLNGSCKIATVNNTKCTEKIKNKKSESMNNLVLTNGLGVQNDVNEDSFEEMKDSEHEDELYDMFDSSLVSPGRSRISSPENPFTRHAGRTSYNPGNKRAFVPPPAIDARSLSPNSPVSPINRTRFSFMPGNKLFNIPPPPSYTPPKEEMNFTLAHLRDTTCHRGSQTDLSIELESLNMEERDSSLQLEEVKTIFAGASTRRCKDTYEVSTDLPQKTNQNSTVQILEQGATISTCIQMPLPVVSKDTASSTPCDKTMNNNYSIFKHTDPVLTSTSTIASTKSSQSNWEKNHVINNSPTVYLPTQSGNVTKRALRDSTNLNVSNQISKFALRESLSPSFKEKQHIQTTRINDSKSNVQTNRPVPLPRHIHYYLDTFNKDASPAISLETNSRKRLVPPVPKKRHSLSYSKSLSSAGDFEIKVAPGQESESSEKRGTIGNLMRTQSCEPCSTLQRGQNLEDKITSIIDAVNKYESIDSEHFYEDIDSKKQEHIYDVCGDVRSDCFTVTKKNSGKKDLNTEKNLIKDYDELSTQFETIKLDFSPGQHRRNKSRGFKAGERVSAHNGLAFSLDELSDVFKQKRYHLGDSDDNSSIADDEMSLSNEEDMEDRRKLLSLRRCVSADNLLRSGSIIDRSMILAKRRRTRIRERRSTSHIFTDNKEFVDFNALSNMHNNPDTKVRYNKRKTTSNERLYKHKPSQNDSGHDSEIVSPCTSPDARRHHINHTSLSYQRPFKDETNLEALRHGTLPKKPWEIRLKNNQIQKKSRSRENLLTLAPKM